jgi:hypothetical protein
MGWRSGVLAAACAATIAALVLLGALLGVDGLQRFGGMQPMLPITALAIFVAGAALLWKPDLGALLVLGGIVSLILEFSGSELAAVNTAVCVILLGAGLMCLDRLPGVTDATALLIAVIAGLALLGYLFDVPELRRGLDSPLTPMAVPTALALLALSAGLVSERREGGLAALVRSDGPGGSLVRRLAPAAILLPVALAYLTYVGQREALVGAGEGLALLGAGLVVILVTLVVVTGSELDRTRRRELAIIDSTVDAVIILDADGRIREFISEEVRVLF